MPHNMVYMIARKTIFMIVLSIRKLREKEIVVKAGDFNVHIGSNPQNYEDQHRDYGDRVRNKKGERILYFCPAINIT